MQNSETPMQKIIRGRINDAGWILFFILSLPIQFLAGIQIAKWIV